MADRPKATNPDRGKHEPYSEEDRRERIFQAARLIVMGLEPDSAAIMVGVSHGTLCKWRSEDPDFQMAVAMRLPYRELRRRLWDLQGEIESLADANTGCSPASLAAWTEQIDRMLKLIEPRPI